MDNILRNKRQKAITSLQYEIRVTGQIIESEQKLIGLYVWNVMSCKIWKLFCSWCGKFVFGVFPCKGGYLLRCCMPRHVREDSAMRE